MPRKTLGELRSQRWFGATDLRSFGHRSRALQMGYAREDFLDKPVVAHHQHLERSRAMPHPLSPTRVEDIKRGIWQAGGFPVELPAMSLSEQFVKPTSMLYRNFLAMETEELLRQHPIDGAVLMGGCDKTTPATIMGAISMNLPVIFMPAGPMMRGHFGGNILGSRLATSGNTGPRRKPATSASSNGTIWRQVSHARRHLHDDGHCLDDDHHRRGARASPCRAPPRSRPPMPRIRAWPRLRPAHRRDGLGGSEAARHHHAQVSRERARRAQRAWRARPMRWSISSRWHGAPGCRST